MHPAISRKRQAIAELARQFEVRRLEVVGSAARGDDFDPARSDADFVVTFAENATLPPLQQFSGLKQALAELLGRPVDLIEAGAIANTYLMAELNAGRELVYAA